MTAKKKVVKSQVTALVLRSCAEDMSSHGGFVWPGVGENATAPDWINNKECGNGLHGWLYGQGDHSVSSYTDEKAKWLVVEVVESGIVMLGGKCKFESAVVRFVGDKKGAGDFMMQNEPRSMSVAIIGATKSCGKNESVIVGALGTATAGDRGTATAGYSGTDARMPSTWVITVTLCVGVTVPRASIYTGTSCGTTATST